MRWGRKREQRGVDVLSVYLTPEAHAEIVMLCIEDDIGEAELIRRALGLYKEKR